MIDWQPVGEFVESLVAAGRCPGAALAVAIEGEPVYSLFAGQARPELAASEQVLWPVASISKLYTAAAIVRLMEQGRITLGLPVHQVIPAFAGGGKENVTLRHLMVHTSGLPYESPEHGSRLAARWSVDDFVDEAIAMDLEFQPGTRQRYSDLGYALAGRIASVVAGKPFDQIVREEVLMPAGLQHTYFPTPEAERHRVAQVVGVIGAEPDSAMYNSDYGLGLAHPAFGVVATLDDLLRFALLFDANGKHRIHSRAAIATMISDQSCADEPGEDVTAAEAPIHPWGIGFMIKGRSRSPELMSPGSYGHGGASGCYVMTDPHYRVTVAFVSNRHYAGHQADFMPRLDQVMNVVMTAVAR